jgi:hypothetical protein
MTPGALIWSQGVKSREGDFLPRRRFVVLSSCWFLSFTLLSKENEAGEEKQIRNLPVRFHIFA